MLRRVTIKGGLGNVYEYAGPGAATLEVPQRATITNMGAELGATTSIFPADEQVRKFMKSQGREDEYRELLPDEDAEYDEVVDLDLSSLQPLVACPHQPGQCKTSVRGRKTSCSAGIYRQLYQRKLCRYCKGSSGIKGA